MYHIIDRVVNCKLALLPRHATRSSEAVDTWASVAEAREALRTSIERSNGSLSSDMSSYDIVRVYTKG
jgi:hypothetical protein